MVSARSMSFNRKGISTIVATVVLILITVAAAMFIAGFVVPLVRDQLNEGTECLGYEDYFLFYEEFDYNCYQMHVRDGGRDYIYALSIEADTVSAEKLENINALRIQFLGGGENVGFEVSNGMAAGNNTGEMRMLNRAVPELTLPEKGGVKTYVYNSSVEFDTVEIYPVLKNDRICAQTDKIRIKGIHCGPGVALEV